MGPRRKGQEAQDTAGALEARAPRWRPGAERLACLDLPAFPLQLLLRRHPEWRDEPAAVVERDAPHGVVTHANAAARASGVLPGQRDGAALGLSSRLRAGVIDAAAVERAAADVLAALQRCSPHVEPAKREAGVFWLHGRGLGRLHAGVRAWGEAILREVRALGLEGRVAIGTAKFATYTLAKGAAEEGNVLVYLTPRDEQRASASVPLAALALPPGARDRLAKLGVLHVGALARLPSGGVLARFGPDVHRLQRLAAGALDERIVPAPEVLPIARHVDLDAPEPSLDGALAHAAELAAPLLDAFDLRARRAAALVLRLELDDGARREEVLEPAQPTNDWRWLERLLRMRLDGKSFGAGAIRIEVELVPTGARPRQHHLFADAKERAPLAAAKAFSALRAALGDDAVVCAKLTSAHLPEHGFTFERLEALSPPHPHPAPDPPLVRRLLDPPFALPPRPHHEPDGWILSGPDRGTVSRLVGPFHLDGGWWRKEVRRHYHFAELAGGDVVWLYYDAERRRWFQQGVVA